MSAFIDLRAKRTDAVPPRSLFGTITEIKDEKALREAENLEPPVQLQKPDKLAPFQPKNAEKVLKKEVDTYERQLHKARSAEGNLKDAEYGAIHFQPKPETITKEIPSGALTYQPKRTYAPLKHDIKPQSRDIELVDQYNRLGLDLRNDYNYDRYKTTSSSNTGYKELGSVLGKGGLFTYKGKEYSTIPEKHTSSDVIAGRKVTPYKSANSKNESIPPNIRHKHGDSICTDFLDDAARIAAELPSVASETSSSKASSKRSSAASKKTSESVPKNEEQDESLYDALGNALRQDIFNGVSYSHLKSLNTSSYTEEVAKRTTESYPPKFGVQRNADTKWNEDMVIHQRLMKQWDAVMAERLASQQKE